MLKIRLYNAWVIPTFLICVAFFYPVVIGYCLSPVEEGYQAAYRYKGNSAWDFEAYGNFVNLQGITNGDPASGHHFWYFSRIKETERPFPYPTLKEPFLFQVDYSNHLNTRFECFQKKIINLANTTCEHVGGIDYFGFSENGIIPKTGYVLAAFNDCLDLKAYIGIFLADDLGGSGDTISARAYIDVTGHQGDQAPWVSVTRDGAIYSGSGKIEPKNVLYKYPVDWNDISAGGAIQIESDEVKKIQLLYPSGTPFVKQHWQGADFSSDGQYFYFVEGYVEAGGGYGYIHSFKVVGEVNWYRERILSNYQIEYYQEPEGISYYDMNDVASYHPDMPRGELHAIVWNNIGGSYIKHYTSIIDVANSDSILDKFQESWNNSVLRIQTGFYNEEGSLENKNVRIVTEGGPVTILP